MKKKTPKDIATQTGIDPFLISDEFEFRPILSGPDDYKDDGPSIKEAIEEL